ncbi:hypothetical protein BV378_02925 [Nostoc sp. RF31YmG]|nr:hypothetical protein BV378_02925 [Nostoc sp. RF31YmG]
MSSIKILQLCPSGSNLFDDPETFLNDLTEQDSEELSGGLAISQVTVSGGFGILANRFLLGNNAAFHAGFRSDIKNGRVTVSIKTYVI